MKVTIAGGGTGGHVFNALALAERLREDHGVDVTFVGSSDGQEATLVPGAGFPFHPVRAEKLVRELSLRTLRAPGIALRSVGACRPLVEGRAAVVGMGGYVSAPAVIAARRAGVRVILHEQNAVPGLANRLLARGASAAGLTFADAAPRFPRRLRTVVTGNPVRDPIRAVAGDRARLAAEAIGSFDLDPGRRTILVVGGSQGARHLNEVADGVARRLSASGDLQLLVSLGRAHAGMLDAVVGWTEPLRIRAFGFIDRMDLAYAVADLAVSRAGANNISELAVCGVPSILVPYPHATEHHQDANAREMVRQGAAELLHDAALTARTLTARIVASLHDPERLRSMRRAAMAWAKPDADRRLARLVMEVAG